MTISLDPFSILTWNLTKIDIRRCLPLQKRDLYGFSQLDVINLKGVCRKMLKVATLIKVLRRTNGRNDILVKLINILPNQLEEMRQTCITEIPATVKSNQAISNQAINNESIKSSKQLIKQAKAI
jgi:hypothetical protein